MQKYTIEELIKTFGKHHEASLRDLAYRRNDFKEKYPDDELPTWLDEREEFSISFAFKSICEEIVTLKEQIATLRKNSNK